jgi:hypothetical protein
LIGSLLIVDGVVSLHNRCDRESICGSNTTERSSSATGA